MLCKKEKHKGYTKWDHYTKGFGKALIQPLLLFFGKPLPGNGVRRISRLFFALLLIIEKRPQGKKRDYNCGNYACNAKANIRPKNKQRNYIYQYCYNTIYFHINHSFCKIPYVRNGGILLPYRFPYVGLRKDDTISDL